MIEKITTAFLICLCFDVSTYNSFTIKRNCKNYITELIKNNSEAIKMKIVMFDKIKLYLRTYVTIYKLIMIHTS